MGEVEFAYHQTFAPCDGIGCQQGFGCEIDQEVNNNNLKYVQVVQDEDIIFRFHRECKYKQICRTLPPRKQVTTCENDKNTFNYSRDCKTVKEV